MPVRTDEPADYIQPLYINGLNGRMLRAPSTTKKQREILLIYGHHALLERWWPLVENLRPYGPVTMPDLPGFGGMESFGKIGIKPDYDAYADYLAAFIKLRYRQKRVTILAISFGFVIVTRMLQRYPELAKKIDILVSVAGFMDRSEFLWSPKTRTFYRFGTRLFATRPVSFLIRYVALNKFVVNSLTRLMPKSKHRYIEISPEVFKTTMDFEVKIWRANDVRTHWLTTSQFFTLDNTKVHINSPVVHVVSKGEHYFNNIVVEQHMRRVFSSYKKFTAASAAHVPHTTADKEATAVMLPAGLRRLLSKKP